MADKKFFTNINDIYFVQDEEATKKLINVAYTFDTTNIMLSKALKDGDIVKTLGYSNINDNGGAFFRISTSKPNDDIYYLKTNDDKYAILILENKMNIKQFGIIGDGKTDITLPFQKAINYVCAYGDSYLYIPKGTYMVKGIDDKTTSETTGHLLDSGGIKLLSGLTLIHDNETIIKCITNDRKQYNVYRLYNVDNVTIKGGTLQGDRETHTGTGGEWGYGIAISGCKNILLENIEIYNMWGDGVNLQYLYKENSLTQDKKIPTNIIINNILSHKNRRQGISIECGENVQVSNSTFKMNSGTEPQTGMDIEPANENSPINNVKIFNCLFKQNGNENITMYSARSTSPITNVVIDDCIFNDTESSDNYNVSINDGVKNVLIKNCNIDFKSYKSYIFVINSSVELTIMNCNITGLYINIYKNTVLRLLNNIIGTLRTGKPLIDISGGKELTVMNNIIPFLESTLISPYSNFDNIEVFIFNNVMKLDSGVQVIKLDRAPNLKLTAINNILNGAGVYGGITDFNTTSNQLISNGGFGGIFIKQNRPTNALRGCMAYDRNIGKPIFYTGSKWILADGTDA